MALFTGILLAFAILGALLWRYIHVPSNLPKTLPKIPIYVSLLGLWSDLGQDEIYDRWLREPLERHGAVRFWFAGKWSILFTRPEYLTQLFRNEDVYAKAGNQKKIPWTVTARLLGDNIISAHGDNWKTYTSIMKPGISKPNFDPRPILDKSRKFVDLLLQDQSKQQAPSGVLVNPLIQRFAIAAVGQSFLDIDFQCLENPTAPILQLQTAIKGSIFKPLYLSFPILDKWPQIFTSRKRAFKLVSEFEDMLYQLVRNRPNKTLKMEKQQQESSQSSDMLIDLLDDALESGKITDQQYRDNLKITFITGHENVQLLMNSLFYELGRKPKIQAKLRAEILSTNTTSPSPSTLHSLPYLTSIITETLRLYPPISQLTNRIALEPTTFGPHPIPAQTYLGWNSYGVHTDPHVWGPQARDFIPERWGTSPEEIQLRFRRECVNGAFIPFNAHTRKCLGQGFVLLEMKMLLFELVRRVSWRVEEGYRLKLPGAGVLAPVKCKVVVEEYRAEGGEGEKKESLL